MLKGSKGESFQNRFCCSETSLVCLLLCSEKGEQTYTFSLQFVLIPNLGFLDSYCLAVNLLLLQWIRFGGFIVGVYSEFVFFVVFLLQVMERELETRLYFCAHERFYHCSIQQGDKCLETISWLLENWNFVALSLMWNLVFPEFGDWLCCENLVDAGMALFTLCCIWFWQWISNVRESFSWWWGSKYRSSLSNTYRRSNSYRQSPSYSDLF